MRKNTSHPWPSFFVIAIGFFLSAITNPTFALDFRDDLQLWYNEPASKWMDSLPIGNGRMGAMVLDHGDGLKLFLNEITCWSGAVDCNNVNPEGLGKLSEIRELLFKKEYPKAQHLIAKYFLGNKNNFGTHLPFGVLNIEFDSLEFSNYTRKLDLTRAVVKSELECEQKAFRREVFASNPDQVIVIRLSANKSNSISFKMSYDPQGKPCEMNYENGSFYISSKAVEKIHSDGKTGVNLAAGIRLVVEGGRSIIAEKSAKVEDANRVTIYISLQTDYVDKNLRSNCFQSLKAAEEAGYENILRRHVSDYRNLFNRVKLIIGPGKEEAEKTIITRLNESKSIDTIDPSLVSLFFQYGRYLLISCSRENSPLPANLQGLWNDNLACKMPWTCDYHLDINTQMNYWLANPGNLPECNRPLFKWIQQRLFPSGQKTAMTLYGSPGWVAHTVSNAWGYSAPGWGIGWGTHVTGGVWIASHMWQHFAYTQDQEFIKSVYPTLKSLGQFYLDYLVEDPESADLVTGPSASPENSFLYKGNSVFETMGPTCDSVLLDQLFLQCSELAAMLGQDMELRNQWVQARKRLPQYKIGKHGQIQEWIEDAEEAEPHHRHTSHLLGVFPFASINPKDTPALAKAAKISLDRRSESLSWEGTGWSYANMICLYARSEEAFKASENLRQVFTKITADNLFTFNPTNIAGAQEEIFSLDGNMGVARGILEMLVQSYNNRIIILPALPREWQEGEIAGIVTEGGFEISLIWKNGLLEEMELLSKNGGICQILYGDFHQKLKTEVGTEYKLNCQLKVIEKNGQ